MAFPAAALLALLLAAAPPDDGGPPPAPPAEAPASGAPAPDAPATDPYVVVTTGEDVRVRAGPSIDHRVLEKLPLGSWLVVTGPAAGGASAGGKGDFLRVRVPGSVPVFVSADLLEVAADGTSATVARTDVLMRPTPGQEYFPIEGQKLQKGDRVQVLGKAEGESGSWLKVLPPARVEFFVHASLLERVAAEGERAEELARITLERRDAYTGGKEAEAARAAEKKVEDAFAAMVEAAARALATAPADTLPADAEVHRAALQQVMTESGSPATRGQAGLVARDYLVRERDVLVARARAEKAAVASELEARLAEVEARYRKALEELARAAPRAAGPRFAAVGTVRRGARGGYELVKGAVVVHAVQSLRYDLAEFVGLRVGVNGKVLEPGGGASLFRVDALEILE